MNARAERGGSPFHDVGAIFPDEVELCWVKPDTPVLEALRVMATHRYSQVPVIAHDRVRGVFSLWTLAHHLLSSPVSLADLTVEDAMERLPEVTVESPLDDVIEHLDRHDAVLVTSPHGVQAMATPMDVLRYFYGIAQPFVLLQEIELALRDLIMVCVSEPELEQCIDRALSGRYRERAVPSTLVDLSFEDYRTIVTARDNWHYFDGVLGRNKAVVSSKLEQVRTIRNNVLHFREPVSGIDHQTLASVRNWLFDKTLLYRQSRAEDSER